MNKPLTPQQQAFADAFNANGGNAIQAYRTAFECRNINPGSINQRISVLCRHPGVRQLIEKTGRKTAKPFLASLDPADINRQWLLREAMQTYNDARQSGQANSAKNALELIGKISGLLVERRELRMIRSIEDLTDEELTAIAEGKTIDASPEPEAELPSETNPED